MKKFKSNLHEFKKKNFELANDNSKAKKRLKLFQKLLTGFPELQKANFDIGADIII